MSAPFSFPASVGFEGLVALRDEGDAHIDAEAEPRFDLSGLEIASSAAVAVLIAWFRYAHAHGKVVRFLAVPPALMNIIEVSGLREALPVDAPPEGASSVAAQRDERMEDR
ncbi:MAG: STAS domain-containing protein [Pseudomonadota bacterium]